MTYWLLKFIITLILKANTQDDSSHNEYLQAVEFANHVQFVLSLFNIAITLQITAIGNTLREKKLLKQNYEVSEIIFAADPQTALEKFIKIQEKKRNIKKPKKRKSV